MCENGLLKIEKGDIQPTSRKQCITLWLRWFLKRILELKCVFPQDGEQNVWEGNKTKDLMKKWEECKDGRTPFRNWIFM